MVPRANRISSGRLLIVESSLASVGVSHKGISYKPARWCKSCDRPHQAAKKDCQECGGKGKVPLEDADGLNVKLPDGEMASLLGVPESERNKVVDAIKDIKIGDGDCIAAFDAYVKAMEKSMSR